MGEHNNNRFKTMSQYDTFAKDFSQSRQAGWPEFELLRPLIKEGSRVLDLGCGNARLRKFLDKQNVKPGAYFGLDLSEGLLKIARKENPQDHFFRGSFGEILPFGADQFEIITAIASFHHLLNKKQQKLFFSEIFRVARPGAQIFITTWKLPHKHYWPNILKGNFKNWNIPFGKEQHPRTYRRTSAKELRHLAKKSGFSIKSCSLFREKNYILIAEK